MANDLFSEATAPSFDDPLGMLAACHRRIEKQLATLARLQRHLPEHGCDADARAAARNILKYFDHAAPNHHADEEKSLFPRLAASAKECATLIGELERDHERLEENWRRLRPLLAAIAGGQRANLSPAQVTEVTSRYQEHMAREENELLPMAERAIDPATLKVVGEEMAARRGVDLAAGPRRGG